jgi:hypothetical protein
MPDLDSSNSCKCRGMKTAAIPCGQVAKPLAVKRASTARKVSVLRSLRSVLVLDHWNTSSQPRREVSTSPQQEQSEVYDAPVLIPALHIEFPSLFVGAPLDGPLVCAMRCGAPLDDSLHTGASLKKAVASSSMSCATPLLNYRREQADSVNKANTLLSMRWQISLRRQCTWLAELPSFISLTEACSDAPIVPHGRSKPQSLFLCLAQKRASLARKHGVPRSCKTSLGHDNMPPSMPCQT